MAQVFSGMQSTSSQVYCGGGVPAQPKTAFAPLGQIATPLLLLVMVLLPSCRRLLLLACSGRGFAVVLPFSGCLVLCKALTELASLLLLQRATNRARSRARDMTALQASILQQ
jgi:hypothetical protein